MTKEEYFDTYYPEITKNDFSVTCKIIQNSLWNSYQDGKIVDASEYLLAYRVCVPLFDMIKEYEYQIKNDLDELDGKHGSPMFDLETLCEISNVIQDMAYICDTYHKHFENIDELDLVKMSQNGTVTTFRPKQIGEQETPNTHSNEQEQTLIKDNKSEHEKWFVRVLNSKISGDDKQKDRLLYSCLSRLYNELCNKNCINRNETENDVFIYRFSGLNGPFPPEKIIHWTGKHVFLGYIVRCLISDRYNAPTDLGTISSFFKSKRGKQMNLSVKNEDVTDFEKEKIHLHPEFINAVDILKKSGFVNVEYTSSRR